MRLMCLLLISSTLLFAQGPEQAKYLLNQVSAEIKKQKNLRFEFQYVLENKEEDIRPVLLIKIETSYCSLIF